MILLYFIIIILSSLILKSFIKFYLTLKSSIKSLLALSLISLKYSLYLLYSLLNLKSRILILESSILIILLSYKAILIIF